MQTVAIQAQKRSTGTRSQLNTLRKQGVIPCIVYGHMDNKPGEKTQGQTVAIDAKTFLKLVGNHKTSNMIMEINMDGEKVNAVIKEMQRDVVSRDIIHIDFQKISMTEKVEVQVPVHLSGEAVGVKLHAGILDHMLRKISIFCLPKDIPEIINVDIAPLDIGGRVLVKDLNLGSAIEVLDDENQVVVHVMTHREAEDIPAATAATAAVGAAAAQPEVIAKGKKEEEGAAPAAAPAGKK